MAKTNIRELWKMKPLPYKEGIVSWEAFPVRIKKMDMQHIFFEDGTKYMLDDLGGKFFLSEDECTQYFIKYYKNENLFVKAEEGEKVIHELKERNLDINDIEISRYDSIDRSVSILLNDKPISFSSLIWRERKDTSSGIQIPFLKLRDLSNQLFSHKEREAITRPVLMVIIDEPATGAIYRIGNHHKFEWEKYADTTGYI